MTYCAAFVSEDSIILTTDTAESRLIRNCADGVFPIEKTFFGETTQFDSFELSDRALKIFLVSEKRLVAAAGEKDSIYTAVSFLRQHSQEHRFMSSLFQSLEDSIKFERDQVELVCVEHCESSLILGCWCSGRGLSFPANKEGRPADAILAGSARNGFEYVTENVSRMLSKTETKNVAHRLVLVNSYHQLVGLHGATTKQRFGGAYVSAAMTKSGVIWQPDVAFFIYSPSEMTPEAQKLEALEAINVFVRNELLFVETRTPSHRNILMAPHLEKEEVERRINKVGANLIEKAFNLRSDYKVFLSREDPYAIMLHHLAPEYCVKTELGMDSVSMSFSPDFYQLLLSKPELLPLQGSAKIEVVPRGLLSKAYKQPSF